MTDSPDHGKDRTGLPAPGAARQVVADVGARRAAADAVHSRLALTSFLVWTLGVFLVFLAAPEAGRDAWASLATLALLPVAALPWLARGRLTDAETARRRRGAPGGGR